MPGEAWPQQHKFAVTGDQEIKYLRVAVTVLQPLADQHAQIVGERRFGIVNRLVLTHHAPQFF